MMLASLKLSIFEHWRRGEEEKRRGEETEVPKGRRDLTRISTTGRRNWPLVVMRLKMNVQ